jgi:Uma2 family endonuclease
MQVHRWTRQQYEQMVLAGIFHPAERLELIEGEIFDMTPQSSLHATTVCLVEDTLRSLYREGYYVRVQMPLAIDGDSEPEPDIAVVTGRPRDYRNAHPHTAVLIVEVADHSLSYDRGQKKTVYARNKIPEYWIVNLAENSLEVYRNPTQDSYQFQMILHPPDLVSPLTQPQVAIAVADLLP